MNELNYTLDFIYRRFLFD